MDDARSTTEVYGETIGQDDEGHIAKVDHDLGLWVLNTHVLEDWDVVNREGVVVSQILSKDRQSALYMSWRGRADQNLTFFSLARMRTDANFSFFFSQFTSSFARSGSFCLAMSF